MEKKIEILSLFSKLDCQSSINQLVEKAYKAAILYLRYNHKKISKILLADDLTFEEAAISAITPLFFQETKDQIPAIIKEFNSWQPPIKTEDDALFFLQKIIAGRAEQYLSHLLKEQDPFFAKILDSVNYSIRKGGYKKFIYFGRKFIVEPDCYEINDKTIDPDSFESLPFILFQNQKALLANIFIYLKNETDFFPAIPLNSLVIRLRNLSSSNFKFQFIGNDAAANFDADELVMIGLRCALEKLKVSYHTKGKLSDCEREKLRKALEDMAEDLKDGGINRGLYEYLKPHLHGLEKEEYQIKYHNILEYLLKVMKTTIREHIVEDMG